MRWGDARAQPEACPQGAALHETAPRIVGLALAATPRVENLALARNPVAASSRPPPTRLRGGGDAERGETLNAEFLMLKCYGVCRRQIAAKAAATLNFALHSLPFSLHRARGAGVAARASPTMGGGRDMSFHSSLFALRTSHFTAYAVPAGPGWLRGRRSACMRACPLPRIDGRFAEQRRRRWGWLHFLVA